MKRNYLKFLLFGILFVGVQEFWVSVLWKLGTESLTTLLFNFFLAVVITEVLFLTVAFYGGKLIDKMFSKLRIADLVSYIVFGMLGLIVIEWVYMGNVPGSGRNQFVMFSTWGGAALIARLFTDESIYLEKIKFVFLKTFIPFAVIFTIFGIIIPSTILITPEQVALSFFLTYNGANFLYPLFNIIYLWFFVNKIRYA
jgi:hypothetical protein